LDFKDNRTHYFLAIYIFDDTSGFHKFYNNNRLRGSQRKKELFLFSISYKNQLVEAAPDEILRPY
ncbi:MAG: hypothetical protein PVG17_13760, partial [Desulfobacterales bacterium]